MGLLNYSTPRPISINENRKFHHKITLSVTQHNSKMKNAIKMLVGGDVVYGPLLILHTLVFVYPTSCLHTEAPTGGTPIQRKNTSHIQEGGMKNRIRGQINEHIMDSRYDLYIVYPK